MKPFPPLLLSFALCAASGAAQAQADWLRGLADVMRAMVGQHQALPPAGNACAPAPLPNRPLYLRGSFNAWNTDPAWRMTWRCDHYELIATLKGEHQFKIADEDWSADADWGRSAGLARLLAGPLALKGPAIEHRFSGQPVRFHLSFRKDKPPHLRLTDCETKPPFGDTTLYLRGTMSNWAALEDNAFRWHCDAYVLNIDLKGTHDFKIGDADWSKTSTVAVSALGRAALDSQGGSANFSRTFSGLHTLTLRVNAQGVPQLSIGPRSFVDGAEPAITDPAALSIGFDSRNLAHKSPFGAQPQGTEFLFSVSSNAPGVQRVKLVVERRDMTGNQQKLDYIPLERLPMTPHPHGTGTRFEQRYRFNEPAVYGYWFEVETQADKYALQNNPDNVYWTREKGSMGPGTVERLPDNIKSVRRYRQTIHAPDLRVPDWAADTVYYYLFPDRFRNGNPTNDPKPERDKYQNHPVELHARWLERPYRPGEGGDAVYNNDFFGGDLEGIIQKLDDIKSLGANALYMTPVFRAASNHKYDTGDFRQIDPAFGSNADFNRLTQEAAKRGMRVVVDTSLNHVGSDSPYFDRFGNFASQDGTSQGAFAKGKPNPASPYFNWFLFDTTQTDPNQQYRGWVGILDLPELNKDSAAWRNHAYRNDDSVTRHWLRQGASGWRMDVAPWVNDSFWREWSATVKQENPQALTVAETWFDASKYFLGDMFDATMNYIFRNAVLDYAAGGKARKIYPNLELTREAYPAPMLQASMNLLSTHDQARALHHFGIAGNPHTDDTPDPAKLAQAKQRLLLAVLFQVGFPGAPTLYYGDEVGVGGGDDPYNRATYPWADQGGQPDLLLRDRVGKLLKLRASHAVLRRGSVSEPLVLTDEVIVLRRQYQDQQALVLLNNATEARPVTLTLPEGKNAWVDVVSGQAFSAAGGQLEVNVPALFGRILLAQ
jgi:cyclomaltodextrinase / maltogenic alpha-amylase / neopullulanase